MATGVPGYWALKAAMALSHGSSDVSKAWSLASKYALWLGSSSERSAAMTLATAGIVFGLYHR